MRNMFAKELLALATENQSIVMLSGDIGNRLFDNYKEAFPERFYNCGVAEANMISLAAGLALSGMRPIAYTITPFITARCFEQIKIDVCYYNQPVTIVGVGGGLSYAELGVTHHGVDDVALMRMYPNMVVMCPADRMEVKLCLRAAMESSGPVYIRLGKKNEPDVHKTEPAFSIGKSIIVREGTDVCLLGIGSILPVTIEAAGILEKAGISTRVVSFHTAQPLDQDMLHEVFSSFKAVATVEEHFLTGGLGAAVAEWLADRSPYKTRLARVGVDSFFLDAGNQDAARKNFGLTPHDIANKMKDFV